MKIQPNNLFHTPQDSQELFDWINQLSGSERVIAFTASGMTWNLAAKIIQHQEEEQLTDEL